MRYVGHLLPDATMNNLSSILTVVVAVAVAGLAYLWRRVSALEAQIRLERKSLAAKTSEADRFAQQTKEKAGELEQAKKQLHETRAKMKRLQKESSPGGGKRARTEVDRPVLSIDSAAAVVHVSNQELEARFAEKLASVEAELKAERDRVRTLEKAEEARKALQNNAPPPPSAGTAEEQVAALEQRLEALRKESEEQERKLKKSLNRAEAKERAAMRRANNNHSLYLVIKGQLELAEDKVALFRRRYEGAKTPDQFRTETEPVDVLPTEVPTPISAESEGDGPLHEDPSTAVEAKEHESMIGLSEPVEDSDADERPKEPAEA